ncbi:MAG: AIPR family protein [Sutterella sp.]|jgi:hypothetical protein|nr:AIPR family protein [Mesosutterella multiformis]MBS5812830.1 AIPR family protein [Sutterella sp.]
MNEELFRNFCDNLNNEVSQLREERGEGKQKSFVETIWDQLPYSEENFVTPVYLNGKFGTRNIGIDGYSLTDEKTLYLIIADWDEFSNRPPLTRIDAEKLFNRLRVFFEVSRNGRILEHPEGLLEPTTEEYGLANLIHEKEMDRVKLLLFTDRLLSERLLKIDEIEKVDNFKMPAEIWGPERLFSLRLSGKSSEPLVHEFSDCSIPLMLATKGEGFRSYLGKIPATKLASMYHEHGGRLLEGNVRSFLTLRTSVNKDIDRTIRTNPEKFFIFNNGIAATARNLKWKDGGHDLAEATDFQIINGGQTTATLAKAAYDNRAGHSPADISGIYVAIKLTEIEDSLSPEEQDDLVRAISQSSNNQNKVSSVDFSSNSPFQRKIEKLSQRIPAPAVDNQQYGTHWFYERVRGAYEQKSLFNEDKKFKREYPKDQVFKKEQLATVELCWDQAPDIVSKGSTKLYAEFISRIDETWSEDNDRGKYEDSYFRKAVALIILFRTLEKEISNQNWYKQDRGYRRNIIAYTISMFSYCFARKTKNKNFNFDAIWKEQKVLPDSPLLPFLLRMAEKVSNCLRSNPKQANISEWAKDGRCWVQMKENFDSDISVWTPDWFLDYVKDEYARKSDAEHDKESADLTSEINNIKFVLEYKNWKNAYEFDLKEARVLTPNQQKIIAKLSGGKFFNIRKYQADAAIEGLEALRNEGFSY